MKYCTKKQSFPLRISEELATFTEEILNGKLHFLCSEGLWGSDSIFKIGKFTHCPHCVKTVRIRSYSGPYFSALGLNTERFGVSLRIQSECGEIRSVNSVNVRKNFATLKIFTLRKRARKLKRWQFYISQFCEKLYTILILKERLVKVQVLSLPFRKLEMSMVDVKT